MKKSIFIIILIVIVGSIFYYIYPKSELETKEVTANILNTENSMAIYLKGEDNRYHQISAIPTDGNYVLNETETYCTEPNDESNKLTGRVTYDSDTKTLSVSTLTKKNTKCYLYFDKSPTSKEVLKNVLKQESNGQVDSFTGPSCESNLDTCGGTMSSANMKQNGIYEAEDDYGISYYYRGAVDNNWVKFGTTTSGEDQGDIWWRIIRINGNGSIRLIYAGTYASGKTPSASDARGEKNLIASKINGSYSRLVAFNKKYRDNKYVGYMYNNTPEVSTSHDEAHKVNSNSEKSTILEQIQLWWDQTNLGTLQNTYIDTDVGFCSDTQVNNTTEKWTSYDTKTGYGYQATTYAAYRRIMFNGSNPTLKCGINPNTKEIDKEAQKRDLYTVTTAQPTKTLTSTVEGNNALPIPVGLITIDEVIFAGSYGRTTNAIYWLSANPGYWTMTPGDFSTNEDARTFYIDFEGAPSYTNVNYDTRGIRPVINLKSNTTFTFDNNEPAGTPTNPYIVNTDI